MLALAALVLAFPPYILISSADTYASCRYRDLLDRWKMWHLRAEFDVARNQRVSGIAVPPQILVR